MLSTFKIDNTNKEQLILKSDDFIFENKFIFCKLKIITFINKIKCIIPAVKRELVNLKRDI